MAKKTAVGWLKERTTFLLEFLENTAKNFIFYLNKFYTQLLNILVPQDITIETEYPVPQFPTRCHAPLGGFEHDHYTTFAAFITKTNFESNGRAFVAAGNLRGLIGGWGGV